MRKSVDIAMVCGILPEVAKGVGMFSIDITRSRFNNTTA